MKITDIVLTEVTGEFTVEGPVSEERIANPLDIYPEFGNRDHGGAEPGGSVQRRDVFLEVRTDEDVTGLFGPVDGPHATILRREMREFLVGRDPLATETIWNLLLRRNRHSYAGYYMMAMSALDCALWDLKGKALGMPVYRLLGGPTQEPVRAYASMLGFSLQPEALAERAQEYQNLGYRAQKWFFRYGPGDGPAGAAKLCGSGYAAPQFGEFGPRSRRPRGAAAAAAHHARDGLSRWCRAAAPTGAPA